MNDLVLMSVGELNGNKNHEIVLKAVAALGNRSIHYVVAGMGEKQQYLTNLAEELGVSKQLHLLGYRNDIVDLYRAADICCFPSIREGLGMAALEGMACGLPLVASDNRGIRSFCVNDENGFVCEPYNVEQFKNAIGKLAEHPEIRWRMGVNNLQTVKRFSTENVLKKIRNIYFVQE